jgi:FAD/FMN-containing dehydrogenase
MAVAEAFAPLHTGCLLNDVHSGLNRTRVAELARPATLEATRSLIGACVRARRPLAIMGARHSMGGQQFLANGLVVDTAALNRIESFDEQRGWVVVEAGIRWPALLDWLQRNPANRRRWTVRQKQTGGDEFSLGGSIAANVHGRGLGIAPLVDDIEWIELIDAQGRRQQLSRDVERELFALVVGGYGLFGLVTRVCLRLIPEQTLQREVSMVRVADLMGRFEQARDRDCRYGDFQFAVDPDSPDFLDLGILSCYRPVDAEATAQPRALGDAGFRHLLHLAHVDKTRAFNEYANYYLSSAGQRYPLVAQHRGIYLDGYHADIDAALGHRGSEMISELYVPRAAFTRFMGLAAEALRQHCANPIYGTVRLIERDDITALAWAREPWACIVFNLHVEHRASGPLEAAAAFRALIDAALECGGSFYLTYHRWARPDQVEAAHPTLRTVLDRKRELDPHGIFQSDWYRHMARCW